MSPDNPRFVVDTHALWWYLRSPERLSAAASAVFRLAEIGSATIVVPAIVIAEFYFLSVKLGQPLVPDKLLSALAEVDGKSCPRWAEPNWRGLTSSLRFQRCTTSSSPRSPQL